MGNRELDDFEACPSSKIAERSLRAGRLAGLEGPEEVLSDERPRIEPLALGEEFALEEADVGGCTSPSARGWGACENCCRWRHWNPDLAMTGASALPESAERAITRLTAVLLIVI